MLHQWKSDVEIILNNRQLMSRNGTAPGKSVCRWEPCMKPESLLENWGPIALTFEEE